MFFLQVTTRSDVSLVLFLGTLGMLVLVIGLILFIIFHQRKVIRYQQRLQQMEIEQQKMMLTASIKLQEEERQRLAADLHDACRCSHRWICRRPFREADEPGVDPRLYHSY